jgi:hypothetical protein
LLTDIDRDVAAMALDRLSDDAAVVEHDQIGIDRDVAAVAGLAFDRGGNLAAHQIQKIGDIERDIAAVGRRRLGFGRDRPTLLTSRRKALAVTDPASPLPVDRAVICGPGSGSTMSDATMTSTLPPWPGPAVRLAICDPPSTVRLFAATVTEQPGPDCGPVAEATIWVFELPMPSSVSAPSIVTLTEPPAPVPAVVLMIFPPLASAIYGADTVTDPALPPAVEVAEAVIPLPAPVKVSTPAR